MPPIFPSLPPSLSGLADVALNLDWSWHRLARTMFRDIDRHLWTRCRNDPIMLLAEVRPERLAECASSPEFMASYAELMRWFEAEKSSDMTWYTRTHPSLRDETTAYFCAEFAFYHSVPIYSGGLGVLAGDHLKTASDLGVPMVGVGILYRGGYFDQKIRQDGWQEDSNETFDLNMTPLVPILGPNGAQHMTVVSTFGRDVYVRAWRLNVGRVPVILLDSELEENHPDDRELLTQLYAGGPELRLRQEWLLGVAGVRVLRALGINPTAWHANEGHAAFMLVERLRELVVAGMPYEEAMAKVRATSTFTTHTPVPAGHDMFPVEQLIACAGPVWDEMGISRDEFVAIGKHPDMDRGTYHMTVAAIRMSRRVNGVSRVHGDVTRHIWSSLWPNRPEKDVPIGYVTNGVHLATWMANALMSLLDRDMGADWSQHVDDPQFWDRVLKLDDRDLWRVHYRLKLALFSLAREEARHAFAQRSREVGQLVGSGVLLDPDSLTIGFARRFATYKRADLVFHDVERLLKILTNPARPVQIVFAGKAHPADTPGKRILQEVYQTTRDPRFEGRIAFVEDYDLRIAHVMVQGADLWLNLPREPMEASGTSGMKAALNGVPQLSTLDGWWQEGFDGSNGWAIPASDPGVPAEIADAAAASRLYELLEQEVVPMFYERDSEALPRRWLEMMRNAIRVAGSKFTSMRMTEEYVRDYYVPSILGDGTHDDPPAPP